MVGLVIRQLVIDRSACVDLPGDLRYRTMAALAIVPLYRAMAELAKMAGQ
jgi:hypothetical protein